MYSGLLHCFCGICRTYSRNRRRRVRRIRAGKIKSSYESDCVGTATLDPSWPEAAHGRYEPTVIDDNVAQADRRVQESDSDDDDDDKDEQDDIWDRMESRVPFGAVILIFFGYIFLGAFMFNRFEGWPMTVSVYFCYITLATVGFGDYVRREKYDVHSATEGDFLGSGHHLRFHFRPSIRLGIALHSLRSVDFGHVL